jgi:hypothetical protein
VETPADRIVRELEALPHWQREEVVRKVFEWTGVVKPPSQFLRRNVTGLVIVGTLVMGLVIGTMFQARSRGLLEITTAPPDASVSIDGYPVRDRSRSPIRLKRGPHILSVESPGYTRDDREIVITPDRALRVQVNLEGSPDTGFEITSDPPGVPVWLDGKLVTDSSGAPARTNFRASRIPPGRHVLEVKPDSRNFPNWGQAVMVYAGEIVKIHAVLIPGREDGF